MKQTIVTTVHFSSILTLNMTTFYRAASVQCALEEVVCGWEGNKMFYGVCVALGFTGTAVCASLYSLLCYHICGNLGMVRQRCHSTTGHKNVTSHLSRPVVPLTAASSSSSTVPKNSFWGDNSSWAGFFQCKWEAENAAWILLSQLQALKWALLTVSGER